MTDRYPSSPRYIQLASLLRARIASGELQPGDELPTYDEFRDEWGYARSVAQDAIDVLKREGLIDSARGRRTKVRARRPILNHSASYTAPDSDGTRMTWKRQCAELGMAGTQKTGRIEEVPAPDNVAAFLGVEPGEPVIVRPRVMLADGEAVELADSYYPVDVARGTPLAEPRLLRGGPYAALAAAGHLPVERLEEVSVRPALAGEQSALKLSAEECIISLIRTVFTEGQRPVECCVMILRADRHRLNYKLPMHT